MKVQVHVGCQITQTLHTLEDLQVHFPVPQQAVEFIIQTERDSSHKYM